MRTSIPEAGGKTGVLVGIRNSVARVEAEGKAAILKGARIMFPYINLGPVHLGTFGLLLWLAAVAATVVLHKNFVRDGVDADALSVVALVVIAGLLGAKTWHELQNVADLKLAIHQIG